MGTPSSLNYFLSCHLLSKAALDCKGLQTLELEHLRSLLVKLEHFRSRLVGLEHSRFLLIGLEYPISLLVGLEHSRSLLMGWNIPGLCWWNVFFPLGVVIVNAFVTSNQRSNNNMIDLYMSTYSYRILKCMSRNVGKTRLFSTVEKWWPWNWIEIWWNKKAS